MPSIQQHSAAQPARHPVPHRADSSSPRPASLRALLAAETIKLRRSMVWVFAVLLPLLAVVTGTVNYSANQGVLSSGWEAFMGQVTVFYGLFFFSVGVALVCAAVWRPEHRGSSWNAMRTTPAGAVRVAVAKTLVSVLPVAVMQLVLTALAWASGVLVLRLDGAPPASVLIDGVLGVLAALPLLALQSLLAMLLASFGAPVALGLLGTMVGLGLSYGGGPLVTVWPSALVTRALTLGTSALSSAGALGWGAIGEVLRGTALSGLVFWTLLVLVARRRERR
ncbi:ABC transporter permease [Actinomyces radicidentis]|uniref:ABC transporter permease n=1 Tax=Actinomyces radicidentis TaxID=111015 RepID=UPI000A81E63C|nr:ABC transporter permease [Actinomyces radicidentis]